MMNCEEPLITNDWNGVTQNECIINTEAFTWQEFESVIKKLKNNISPGEDMIASEMLKEMGDN